MSLQPFDAGSVFGEGRYVVTSETLLGKGTQGNVYSAQHRESGASIAVKVIDRLDFEGDPRKTQQLQREMDIAYKLKHPNIVNLRDVVFEPPEPNHEYVMLISDLVDGGSLYEHVQHGAMPEPDAQYVFKQIISGVEYCHKQGVVHRDLKLENLLLTATPPQVVKIADFGVSKDTSVNSMPKTQVGTISYMAPEVTMINKRDSGVLDYGAAADVWSLGVILFVLVCGRYPFGFDGPKSQGGMPTFRVYERIRSGLVEFPPSLSPEILEMLQGMLTTDPLSRWTLERIRGCAWYQGGKFYVPPPVELELGTPSIRWPDPSPRAAAAAAAAADPFSSVRTAELNGFSVSPRSLGDDMDSCFGSETYQDGLAAGGLLSVDSDGRFNSTRSVTFDMMDDDDDDDADAGGCTFQMDDAGEMGYPGAAASRHSGIMTATPPLDSA